MTNQVQNLARVQSGAPSAMVFHEQPQDDPVRRIIIRDSRFSGAASTGTPGTGEWGQGNGVVVETEFPRGLILAHEMTGSGVMRHRMQGQLLVSNTQSGNLTLRIYTSNDPDPKVALASCVLRATHTVAIADPNPNATASLGDFDWLFELLPCGGNDLANVQLWRSTFSYRRWGADALQIDRAAGQLSSTTSPTAPDLHFDTIIFPTTQKTTLSSGSRVLPYSVDAYIDSGESGAA